MKKKKYAKLITSVRSKKKLGKFRIDETAGAAPVRRSQGGSPRGHAVEPDADDRRLSANSP
jgi:hypothetical protein